MGLANAILQAGVHPTYHAGKRLSNENDAFEEVEKAKSRLKIKRRLKAGGPGSGWTTENGHIMHEKLSNQKGTNAGGMYKGSDGVTRYVKFYQDKGQGKAEAAANTIYNSLGISAPKSQIFGEGNYAHEIIPGGNLLQDEGLTKENAREVLKGFAADVLTANWDAVGLTYDNILMKDGKASRLDNGASFTYRAQGGSKPQALLNKTTEYEGFFNPAINREYAALTKKAGYKSADEIPDIKQQVSKIADLEKSSGGWDKYLSKNAPYLSDHERQTFAKMLTARTAALTSKFPNLQGSKMLTQLIIEAGGAGSGWTTENGHVSHKTGNTYETGPMGPGKQGSVSLKLKSLGLEYHHTHVVTLEHKAVPKDYYVDPSKKLAVALKKGSKGDKSWEIGHVLTIGNKSVFTKKGDGIDTAALFQALVKEHGYPDKGNESGGISPVTNLEQLHKVQAPLADLKKAVDEAKMPVKNAVPPEAAAKLDKLGFKGGLLPTGQTALYTHPDGSTIAITQGGHWSSATPDSHTTTSGSGYASFISHLSDLLIKPLYKAPEANIATVGTGVHAQLKDLGFTGPSPYGNGSTVAYTKGSEQFLISSSPSTGMSWEYTNGKAKTNGNGLESLKNGVTLLQKLSQSDVIKNLNKAIGDAGNIKPVPQGVPENIAKLKELGFTQGNNAADGKSTKWEHSNGMTAITKEADSYETNWKLFDKDGNTLSTGQGPSKLEQQVAKNGGKVPGVNSPDKPVWNKPSAALDAMHKIFTEGDGYTYQKSETAPSGAVNHIYTKPNPDAGGAFAKAIQENKYDPNAPNIINMGKTQYDGSPLKNPGAGVNGLDGPKFSPTSKAQTWLQQKADDLAQKGFIYKKTSPLSSTPGGAWHKYADPGTSKDSTTTSAMIVEKPGGTHELLFTDNAKYGADESKVDSVESYPTGAISPVTKPGKEYESNEGIPKPVKTDKAYYKKVADTVAQVLKDNPPDYASKGQNLSGYTSEGQKNLRLAAAAKLGVSADAISKVQYDISNWTGSSFKEMRQEGLKVIDKKEDADPAWIIEHEVTKQQLKKTYGETVDVVRGLSIGDDSSSSYKSEFPAAMTKQLIAIKNLIQSASPKWDIALQSHGGDSWSLATHISKSFGNLLIKAPKTSIDYAVTSFATNPNFGGGEQEIVIAFPKGEIPVNKKTAVLASFTALPSDALIAGYIGTLRKAGWKIEVKGKKIIIHEKYPQTGNPPKKITAGGPGSGRHKEFPNVAPKVQKPRLSLKQANAILTYKPADKAIHKTAGIGEQLVRDALRAVPTNDNRPFDVVTRNGRHAIEVKTLTTQTNDKITMHPASLRRKYAWAAANGAKAHTVVLDMRHGAKTPSAVYHHEGIGSFRLTNMHQLTDGLAGLKRAIR